jgi:transcription initiation factor TFIID subunit 1
LPSAAATTITTKLESIGAFSNIFYDICRFEYRTAQAFLREFELMRDNAVKFNGQGSILAGEGAAIYEYVNEQIQANADELETLEAAIVEQLTRPNKHKRLEGESKSKSSSPVSSVGGDFILDGVAVNFGDLNQFQDIGSDDSDEDDSYSGLMDLQGM